MLPERVEYLERITPWLEQLLTGLPSHHARLIRPFGHWFVLRRARRTAQKRSYTQTAGASARRRILAAVDFLGWLDTRGLTLASLSQADVDQWLTGGATPRYNVAAFLTWTAERQLTPKLTVPARSFKQPPHRLLSNDEHRQQLRRCLTDTTLPVDVRAAGALATLFGIAVTRIVSLTVDHITQRDDATYLTIDQHPVLIPPSLAALLHAAAQAPSRSALGRSLPRKRWLFPGSGNPGRPMAAGTLSRRLLDHGIDARSTRNTGSPLGLRPRASGRPVKWWGWTSTRGCCRWRRPDPFRCCPRSNGARRAPMTCHSRKPRSTWSSASRACSLSPTCRQR